ncbi:hypothetical protein [Stenotrophomonas sp. NPDC078853]|uniref:hypothetical protein n=1 Tax=Stenotrophomonas sp. NPDC078853 TaxID=3364534 RepID=UPI00384D43E8
MPAPDLKPQIPGEPLNDASTDPQAALRAELEAIAGLNAPEVIDGLATMSRSRSVSALVRYADEEMGSVAESLRRNSPALNGSNRV